MVLIECIWCLLEDTTTNSREKVFKNVVGTIYSQNYPEDYPNNLYRLYRIIAPQRSEIMVFFDDFDLESKYDTLKVGKFGVHQTFQFYQYN